MDQMSMDQGRVQFAWNMTMLPPVVGLRDASTKPKAPVRRGKERFSPLIEHEACLAVVGAMTDWAKLDEAVAKMHGDEASGKDK